MSAQLFPSQPDPAHTPTFTVLPPVEASDTETYSNPSGAAAGSRLPEPIKAALRNPFVLAGGAVVAGVVLTRVLGTTAGRRIAKELATEAMKHMKPTASSVAGMAGTAAASTLLERGVEKFGPQITDYAKKMLADILRKKE
ncbi:MAG: hypothetical protein JWM59_4802 [Verrucomicrobiales bacterium]|nr:hypothetical protein [Verrucomicrobiales bacterium]